MVYVFRGAHTRGNGREENGWGQTAQSKIVWRRLYGREAVWREAGVDVGTRPTLLSILHVRNGKIAP